MLVEALSHLVRGIVDYPEQVEVYSRRHRRGDTLEIRVHPDDLGRVIGRGGRTVNSLRMVIGAIAQSRHIRVDVNSNERR